MLQKTIKKCFSSVVRIQEPFAKETAFLTSTEKDTAILGWGRKLSGQNAITRAEREKKPFLLLEDGFLRSGDREDHTSSLILDRKGVYYDCHASSQLEDYILEPLSDAERLRAQNLICAWRNARVSKYNAAPEYSGDLPDRYVLVMDQVYGDLSVTYGGADIRSFQSMLAQALTGHPDAHVVVKVHPDIFTRGKKGYFAPDDLRKNSRIIVVAENCHPVSLIEHALCVYTVTSQTGFEALLWGKDVHVFGIPFYAGWGLTRDFQTAPDRRCPVSLEQLVTGVLIRYTRYIHPETGMLCSPEELIDFFALQRRMCFRFPSNIYAVGFSKWKRPFLKQFLQSSTIHFVSEIQTIPEHATVAVWGSAEYAFKDPVHLLRVEDGFLRSSGLGAHLVPPLSWVLDDMGIYYDASRVSRLEKVLNTTEFSQPLIERAHRIMTLLHEKAVTKYNLSGQLWQRPEQKTKVILVPGQVENDASIRFGSSQIKTNIQLLQTVRAAYKDAYIIYKPHPDVVAGVRCKGISEDEASHYCDEILEKTSLLDLLKQIDEVHTMTSLLGFEALIRNIPVFCYGQPFYSGWGLTCDFTHNLRRTRQLTLEELVAGALILYPTYISRDTRKYTTPERVIEELASWKQQGPSTRNLRLRMLRFLIKIWTQSGFRRNA